MHGIKIKASRDSSLPGCELRMMMIRVYPNQINNNKQTNGWNIPQTIAKKRDENPATLVWSTRTEHVLEKYCALSKRKEEKKIKHITWLLQGECIFLLWTLWTLASHELNIIAKWINSQSNRCHSPFVCKVWMLILL